MDSDIADLCRLAPCRGGPRPAEALSSSLRRCQEELAGHGQALVHALQQHASHLLAQRYARSAAFASIATSLAQGHRRWKGDKQQQLGGRPPNPSHQLAVSVPADEGKDKERADERFLISEVVVRGISGELLEVAQGALNLRPNFGYTLGEVEATVRRIFNTGYFEEVRPDMDVTRDGCKLTIDLKANPQLRGVVVTGASALPQSVVARAFAAQHDRTLNFSAFREAVTSLNQWYWDRDLSGQVTGVKMDADGRSEITITEMTVGDIALRFTNRKTGAQSEAGATRPEVIRRHLTLRPGQVWSAKQAKADIDAVYNMGIFDDVTLLPQPTPDAKEGDAQRADLVLNLVERPSGGVSGGGGISAQGHAEGALPGFVGSASFVERNLFGLNQKLAATIEAGQVDSLFRIHHTDPWVGSNPQRTSRVVSLQNTRTSGNAIHGRATDDPGAAGPPGAEASEEGAAEGNVILARLVGGVEWERPLAAGWSGTLGLNWQRAKAMNEHGQTITKDAYGSPLTFSGGSSDLLALALLRVSYSDRTGAQAVLSAEQAVPLRAGWLNLNRFRGRVEQTVPLGKGLEATLVGKGGCIFGDLPPYEAFAIGGINSVRGYQEGGVGSGRSYAAGTAELHFPLFGPVEGTLFGDWGSDLDSGQSVLGDPAGARGKPGTGYGCGAGVRVASPLGPLRLECAYNDKGLRRFHLGVGSRG